MRCSKCGTEYEGLFCPECGTKAGFDTSENTDKAYIKCRNCGTEYDGMFCPRCGIKADEANSVQTVKPNINSQSGRKVNSAAKTSKKNIGLITVIACAVLVTAGTASLWVIKNRDTSDTAGIAVQSTQANTSSMANTAQNTQSNVNGTANSQPVQSTPVPTVYVQNQGSAAVNAGNGENQRVSWSGSSEEYLKDYRLNREQFSEEDILSLSQSELRMLLNGLYAYHGYTFTTDDYKRLFGRMSWYTPQEKTMEACESEFNTIERANKELFIAREKAMGWR